MLKFIQNTRISSLVFASAALIALISVSQITPAAAQGVPAGLLRLDSAPAYNAQASLESLEAQPAPGVPTVAPLEQSSFAQTVQIGGGAAAARAQMDAEARGAAAAPPVLATEAPTAAGHADPELLSLFIEEAREEVARIATDFPVWEHNPLELSALLSVRGTPLRLTVPRSSTQTRSHGRVVQRRTAWSSMNSAVSPSSMRGAASRPASTTARRPRWPTDCKRSTSGDAPRFSSCSPEVSTKGWS